jgi:glycosyltransferase involved in cell wall biosynthesis
LAGSIYWMDEFNGFSVNFVSTWYPRICGIATFTEHTITALALNEEDIQHIKIHPIDKNEFTYHYPIRDKHVIKQLDPSSWLDAAEMIIERHQKNDEKGIRTVAILEHEYGLDGNGRGNNYNAVAKRLHHAGVPTIVVLHTVLKQPDDHQREVIRQFGEQCDRLVIITPSSKDVLRQVYGVDEKKIVHIPHGIPETHKKMTRTDAKEKWGLAGRYVISTMGLVSKNKGIEYGIRGFARFLDTVHPAFRERMVYVIAGQTHPEELAKQGGDDPYRDMLYEIAADEGLNPTCVTTTNKLDFPDSKAIFFNRYLTEDEYIELVKASECTLLPYRNPEQNSSGTLATSIGLGTAVVATKFRYAEDLFSDIHGCPDGSGVLIDFSDEAEIAKGLRDAFENLTEIESKAYQKGVMMGWSVVGKQYLNLFYQISMKPAEIERAHIHFLS